MTIPTIYLLQDLKKNIELTNHLQKGLTAHFFKHTMYGVKDALSTILALCDMEEMKNIDRVKSSIQRVNAYIEDVALYHSGQAFNARHVLENILKVLNDYYKGQLQLTLEANLNDALVYAKQAHFEKSLLFLFIQIFEQSKIQNENEGEPIATSVRLVQKNMDMEIAIYFEGKYFDPTIEKEVLSFVNKESLKLVIREQKKGMELVLTAPLAMSHSSIENFKSDLHFKIQDFKKKDSSKEIEKSV